MNVVMIGGNFRNRGAEAMLRTAIAEITSRRGDASFTVVTYDRRRDGAAPAGLPAAVVDAGSLRSFGVRALLLLLGRRLGARLLAASPLAATCLRAHWVLDVSGFALSDRRPAWRAAVVALEALLARRLGAGFGLLTQAFGPFERLPVRCLARIALSNARFVVARGRASAHHLAGLGRVEGHDFTVAEDMAWLFAPAAPDRSDAAAAVLGCAPNTNLYRRADGDGAANAYVVLLADVLRRAIDSLGVQVLLLAHDSLPERFDDDALGALLAQRIDRPAAVRLVGATQPAAELKQAVGGCSLVLSSRFHVLIAAQSLAIPTLSLGWAHKYEESTVVDAAGWSFDFDRVDADVLWAALERACGLRAGMRGRLQDARAAAIASARTAFDELEHCMGAHEPRPR
jgi:polysaccharide pyruvyl transferase WcaK-like protein